MDSSAASRGSRRILLNALYRGLGDAGSKLAGLALQIAIARTLGADEFGVFVYAVSFVGLATILGDFGQDVILTREVARDHGRLNELFGSTIALRVLASVPLLLVAIGVARVLGLPLETCAVILLIGAAYVVDYVTKTSFAVFQAYERLGYVSAVLVLQRWLTALIGGGLLLAGAGVVTVSAVYLAGAVIALATANALLFRRVVRPQISIEIGRVRQLLVVAIPVGLAGVFYAALFRVDTLILGAFDTTEVVGQYGAAARLLEGTLFVSWGVAAALLPVLSRSSSETFPSLAAVFERGLKLVASVAMPVALGAGFLAGPIIDLLYGPPYEASTSALRLIAPTIVLFGLNIVSSYLLIALEQTRVLAITYAVGLAINVGLNLILIPRFSLDGAAAATTMTEAMVTVAVVAIAVRSAGSPTNPFRALISPIVAGVAGSSALLVLAASPLVALAVGVATFVATLAGIEWLFFREDFELVRRALRTRLNPRHARPDSL